MYAASASGFSLDISILTSNRGRSGRDREKDRMVKERHDGIIEDVKTFTLPLNSLTLPATCNSVVLRQRHYSFSLYQHQTDFFLLISILVTAVLSCWSFPWHRPLYFFIYLTPPLKSRLAGRKLIFSVFPFVQLPLSCSQSLSLSVLPCVTAFHFVLLFFYLFLEPLCRSCSC